MPEKRFSPVSAFSTPPLPHPTTNKPKMYVYIRTEKEDFWTDIQGQEQYSPGLWTVGHYAPDGKFQPESDHNSPDAAAQRVHFLNGGKTELS